MAGPDAITDFNQFAGLRAQARKNDAATIHKVAQQFEALFTQQLMKGMRSGSLGSDVMGGGQTEFYQDIFDQQMAVHLSSGKGLGLADLLVKQLRGKQADAAPPASTKTAAGLPLQASARWMPLGAAAGSTTTSAGTAATAATSGSDPLSPLALQRLAQRWARAAAPASDAISDTASPSVPAATANEQTTDAVAATNFVNAIRPHAERAARELGVPTQLLMAQAALETGWGQHAVRGSAGAPSFNFFGIKADKSWQGASVQTTTSEYRTGAIGAQPTQEAAQFRAYDSPSAAFDDYVDFLKSNPRYQQALQSGGNPTAFAYGLQQAGYATDPAYAQKLLKVAYGPTMRAAMAQAPRQYAL